MTDTTIPAAEVLGVQGQTATIRCPYCAATHRHSILARGRQHFAPQCGATLPPDDRGTGYTFHVERPQP